MCPHFGKTSVDGAKIAPMTPVPWTPPLKLAVAFDNVKRHPARLSRRHLVAWKRPSDAPGETPLDAVPVEGLVPAFVRDDLAIAYGTPILGLVFGAQEIVETQNLNVVLEHIRVLSPLHDLLGVPVAQRIQGP
jgi:hypothetical protein